MQNEKRQSYGIIYKSVLFFLILYYPVLYAHELGHALVCVLEGGQSEIPYVSLSGEGHGSCTYPEPHDLFLYHISGGAFASALSATLLILWRSIPNYVKIVSITFAIVQGLNALIESFANSSYLNDPTMRSIIFNVITFALFTGLMFLYVRQPSKSNSSFSNSETKIQELCSKCDNNNPKESAFCNKCGFALK
jgi:hypothetical protein